MMSKIRNLIEKLKNKAKKSEDESEEIIIGDENFDEEEIEFDEDQEIDLEEEAPEDLPSDHDEREEETIMAKNSSDEDKTGDIPIQDFQSEIEDEDKTGDIPVEIKRPVSDLTDEDATGEIPVQMSNKNNIDFEDEEDIEARVEKELTNSQIDDSIDLDNSNLTYKDKAQMLFQKVKDKANRFNRKKFQQLTIDNAKSDEEEKPIINKSRKKVNDITSKAKSSLTKVDWKNIHKEFFSEDKRNLIHKSFQGLIIISFIFLTGKYTALMLKGADKDANIMNSNINIDDSKLLTKEDINNIKQSKIFKTEATKKVVNKNPVQKVAKCESAIRKSNLPITLINTIVLQDSVKSIAAVQVRSSNKPSSLREGDQIQGIAELSKIDRMKIIIKNLSSGGCEYVEAKQEGGSRRKSPISVMTPNQSTAYKKRAKNIDGIENDGNDFTVEKAFLQNKLKDINSILTQARGVQLTNPDGSLSFKIVEIQPGSIFSYLGIENNDIITEIGGKKINNLNQVMSLFGSISNLDKLNLKIKRNGEEVPLNYKFR